jgi:hypothetical protein
MKKLRLKISRQGPFNYTHDGIWKLGWPSVTGRTVEVIYLNSWTAAPPQILILILYLCKWLADRPHGKVFKLPYRPTKSTAWYANYLSGGRRAPHGTQITWAADEEHRMIYSNYLSGWSEAPHGTLITWAADEEHRMVRKLPERPTKSTAWYTLITWAADQKHRMVL